MKNLKNALFIGLLLSQACLHADYLDLGDNSTVEDRYYRDKPSFYMAVNNDALKEKTATWLDYVDGQNQYDKYQNTFDKEGQIAALNELMLQGALAQEAEAAYYNSPEYKAWDNFTDTYGMVAPNQNYIDQDRADRLQDFYNEYVNN